MAFVNRAVKEVVLKIAYHGPGLGGKTTNLRYIAETLPPGKHGELLTLDTATERTLFFDFLLVTLGGIEGYQARLHLYTVPGQLYYTASRKLILKGVDAIVFVVDSQAARLADNEQSLLLLNQDLQDIGLDPKEIPTVVQYNKRDTPDSLPLPELQERFNPDRVPYHEAMARHGAGVMETLRTVTRLALARLAPPKEVRA